MDAVFLARIQFAITVGFHFIFPPLTIGMAWLIFWMKVKALRTGDEQYQRMSQFWLRLFALSFAIGVATGITMEFQFGTNWSEYSRYVGDIFGAPLAAEGVLAFFLESTFMGLLLFAEKRLSPRMHVVSAFMVAFGATLSAFWIIVANSWQQTPAGYEIVNGRAELTDFFGALFNPSTMPRYTHTVSGALITGSFFVLGISAFYLLRKRHEEFAKRSFRMALILAFVVSLAQLGTGHYHAVQVAETQPVKLAAFEGLFETQRGAPLLFFGIPNEEEGRTEAAVGVPGGLSLLVDFDSSHEVPGLDAVPRDQWPPVRATFFPFHIMFLVGLFFIGYTGLGVILLWRRKLFNLESGLSRLMLKVAVIAVPLPFLANELGWMAAEVGRQPWAVQGLLRTSDAVSVTVPASQILFSIIMFCLIYALLFALWIFLLRQKIRLGPEAASAEAEEERGEVAA